MLRMNLSDLMKLVMKNKKMIQTTASFSYLLSDIDDSGNMSYTVAHESEVASIRSNLHKTILSETIYAIHRLHSSSYKTELFSSECDQATEILSMSHPSSDYFLSNSGGYITCICDSIDIRPNGQRILQSTNNKQVTTSIANDKVQKFVSIQASVLKALDTKDKQSESVPVMRKSKSSIEASSYFTKGSAVTNTASSAASTSTALLGVPVVKKDALLSTKEPVTSTASPSVGHVHSTEMTVKGNSHNKVVEDKKRSNVGTKNNEDDDGDDEWESEYKPDHNKLKEINKNMILSKRKASQLVVASMPSSTEAEGNVDHDDDADDEDNIYASNDSKHQDKLNKSNKRINANHIHGAMDSYMEDIAIADYKQQQQLVAINDTESGDQQQVKRKKRKLVEKVTQTYVYVYVTVDV